MQSRDALPTLGGISLLSLVAIVGAWLPWYRQNPDAPYHPVFVPGMQLGFGNPIEDQLIIVVVLGILAYSLGATYFGWRFDVVLIGGGLAIIIPSGWHILEHLDVVPIEPGFWAVFLSGLLFLTIGVLRWRRPRASQSS